MAAGEVARPALAAEGGAAAFVRGTWLQGGRVLRRSLRMPAVVIQSILFPVVLLLLLLAGFGEVVADFDDRDYVQRIVPLIAVSGALFGALANGAAVITERRGGLFDRFRALPIHRAAPLAGRVLGEAGRIVVSTVVVVAVGAVAGFRFGGGVAGTVGFFALVVLYGTAFSWVVVALALRAERLEALSLLAPLFLLLLFLNTGMVPLDAYPGALQPVVRWAPHTAVVDALAGLAGDGPVAGPLGRAVAWSVGITAVFATVFVRRYRRG